MKQIGDVSKKALEEFIATADAAPAKLTSIPDDRRPFGELIYTPPFCKLTEQYDEDAIEAMIHDEMVRTAQVLSIDMEMTPPIIINARMMLAEDHANIFSIYHIRNLFEAIRRRAVKISSGKLIEMPTVYGRLNSQYLHEAITTFCYALSLERKNTEQELRQRLNHELAKYPPDIALLQNLQEQAVGAGLRIIAKEASYHIEQLQRNA